MDLTTNMIYQNFTLPKGDSLTFKITLVDAEDAPDNIYFTIKKNANDTTPTIQKYIGNGITRTTDTENISYEVYLSSDETEDLELLNYSHAIKLIFGSEENTEVEGKLVITPERASTLEVN